MNWQDASRVRGRQSRDTKVVRNCNNGERRKISWVEIVGTRQDKEDKVLSNLLSFGW